MKGDERMDVSKNEVFLLIGVLVFGIVYSVFLLLFLAGSDWFNALNPVEQYFLFSLGLLLVTLVIFGGVISFVKSKPLNLPSLTLDGVASWLVFSFVIDMWYPPNAYDFFGNAIFSTNSSALSNVGVDRMMGFVFESMGVSGIPLYLAIYVLTPVLVGIIAALVLTEGKFFSMWKEGSS